ncbi:CAF17-like 4Fe-4S cluster assembly/insertion protein YgfZ [Ensifer adhaerens]|uniref:CAF17-like 4Fe-4S cluster assembly/insertion protein YgfZ n=1 Tax=Ensifer adhaerens TaxID=106592 RepID=UPI001C4E0828|nr:folate-binding protein YgfZ [Ensifer adhaerens]MBW0364863.1 folate-binding protein YgfZ [Ensifer adhaerens]UCM20801.1 folate-binding protein YgfZ [Ensifer adhaerens]
MPRVRLDDRAIVSISGKDAEDLLQGLITTDLDALAPDEARPGALLTPQGKILFEFLISRDGDGLRLETARDQAEALLKRMTMYKLRSAVELSIDASQAVTVMFDEAAAEGAYRDHRFEKAGIQVFRAYGEPAGDTAGAEDLERLRIAAGIANAGADYAVQDAFPHDVLLDKNGGLSFKKGCYVGQEVVSRMQHRSTPRRRVVIVSADAALPPTGTTITANDKSIGALGTVQGKSALAIVRIDKAGEAMANGIPLLAGDVAVTMVLPEWTGLTFPTSTDEASA